MKPDFYIKNLGSEGWDTFEKKKKMGTLDSLKSIKKMERINPTTHTHILITLGKISNVQLIFMHIRKWVINDNINEL